MTFITALLIFIQNILLANDLYNANTPNIDYKQNNSFYEQKTDYKNTSVFDPKMKELQINLEKVLPIPGQKSVGNTVSQIRKKQDNALPTTLRNGSGSKQPLNQIPNENTVNNIGVPSIDLLKVVTKANQYTLDINGSGEKGALIRYSILDSQNKSINGTSQVNESGGFHIVSDIKSLANGKISVEISQEKNGIHSLKTVKTISINNVTQNISPPSISELNDVTLSNQTSYEIKGAGEQNTTIDFIIKDGQNKEVKGQATTSSSGAFTSLVNLQSLQNGTLTIEVTQTKNNVKSPKAIKTFIKNVINEVPAPVINEVPSVTQANVKAFNITGVAEANAKIQYVITDKNNQSINGMVDSKLDRTFLISTDIHSLADGTLTVEIKQIKDGIQSKAVTLNTLKDTSEPITTINETPDITFNNQFSYDIVGTTEANADVSITLKDKEDSVLTKLVKSDGFGTFSTSIDTQNLKNGTLQLEVKTTNQKGNIGLLALKNIEKDNTLYELNKLEQNKWSVYNDGSHPVETTNGFNDALAWTQQKGIKTFKVPAGTYMVQKADPALWRDSAACINMVPNITFLLDDNAVIQKETNAKEAYSTVCVGYGDDNVTLKGGNYKGDKDTHDYSQKETPYTPGTHENGIGISVYGAKNLTIEGIKATNFTGDGLGIGGQGTLIQDLYEGHFESGAIDTNGNPIADSAKIRMKAPLKLNKEILKTEPYLEMPNAKNLSYLYDLYFYKADGSFLSKYSVTKPKEVVMIPNGADSIKAVFKKSNTTGVYAEFWNKALATDVIVKDSEFAFNRRQGITIGGADNVLITNSVFHDIKGVAPESGIDVEGGYGENGMMNKNIFIKNNTFYNNNKYDVILYDGHDGVVEGNYLGSKWKIGLAVSDPFTNALIKDNTFDNASIYSSHDVTFKGNTITGGTMNVQGPNAVIDGMTFNGGTGFGISASQPFGVEAKNLTLNNTNLNIWVNPIHLSNITVNGGNIGGQAPDGSVFDNLKVLNHPGTSLIRGTYNNCTFESSPTATGGVHVDYNGNYMFNGCTFKANKGTFNVVNKDANVTVQNSQFEVTGDTTVVNIPMGNKVDLLNNTINSGLLPGMNKAVIKVGDYWNKDKEFQVQQANIVGNTITSLSPIDGINTIYAGLNAPGYTIKDNILHKAKLRLRPDDINNNNLELAS